MNSLISFSDVKVGSKLVIRNQPYEIIEVNISAPGKHGSAKKTVTGIHVFTGKKIETIVKHKDTIYEPHVQKKTYQVTYIDDENYLSLFELGSETRNDIRADDEMAKQLSRLLTGNHNVYVCVLEYKNNFKISSVQTQK